MFKSEQLGARRGALESLETRELQSSPRGCRLMLAPMVLILAGSLFISCDGGGSSPTAPEPLCQLSSPPGISITFVPPLGSTQSVRGTVLFTETPCDPQFYRVALYIHVPGFSSDFICKPSDTQPLSMLSPAGGWDILYATGGNDTTATEIAAFLVSRSFSNPCFTDQLPSIDGVTVLASASVDR